MTGILPVKKYGTHSALNMFDEYSMINPGKFAEYVGFTENEVREYCNRYQMNFDTVKRWYDGYTLREYDESRDTMLYEYHIYNPRAVVSALTSRSFQSYWTQTETFEALRTYFDLNQEGLRDKIIHMLSGERIKIQIGGFQNDMTTFECADDVLTLLIHLGYLTYDNIDKTVRIPNDEIQSEFYLYVTRTRQWTDVINALDRFQALLKAGISVL